jgi:hypothetical protein
MLLVIQVALGIVLGVLILRYLPQVLAAGIIGIAVVAAVLLSILAWSFASKHLEDASVVAFIIALTLSIQYSARGLGYLYIACRPRLQNYRRWRNLLNLAGIEDAWLTSDRPRAEIARAVGDRLFGGFLFFALAYFLLTMALWMPIILLVDSLLGGRLPIAYSHPTLVAIIGWSSAAVTGVALYAWLGRRSSR